MKPFRFAAGLALLLVLAFQVLSPNLMAQTGNPPELMSYQGFLADATGAPLANDRPRNYDIVFRVFTASTGGTRVWSERQTVTVDKGYFSILLGQGIAVNGEANSSATISGLFLSATASDRFLGLTVIGQGAGGSDLLIEPRLRLMPGPYSFLARNANGVVSAAGVQVIGLVGNTVNITNTGSALNLNGTMTATAFAGNGSALTALNAASMNAGTLPDARLSANVLMLAGDQTVTGTKNFNGGTYIQSSFMNFSGTGQLGLYGTSSMVVNHTANVYFNENSALHFTGATAINMNDRPIRLRNSTDNNHVLAFNDFYPGGTFGGFADMNGPVLTGYRGGLLGTTEGGNKAVLRWSADRAEIVGREASDPNSAVAYAEAEHLVIRARDLWEGVSRGVRLSLGMAHINGFEFAGVIQAYGDNNPFGGNVTTLRLNPRGGEVKAVISSPSDRNLKQDLKPVDPKDVLARLTRMPVMQWSYTNSATVPHMGPTAQDFKAAFGLGESDLGITTVDADGVAMAAIQGLNQVVMEKDRELQELKRELQELRAMVKGLAGAAAATAGSADRQ